jgi:uncharacterized protein
VTSPPEGTPHPDAAAVAALIGRPPHTRYRVAVRCPFGGPAVLENEPVDLRGNPFPTRYWLACRRLVESVSRLESAGGVRRMEAAPGMDQALREASARHRALHAGHNIGGAGDPARAKCLHAHLAFGLATGGGPVTDWIAAHADTAWPAVCCLGAPERGDG